MQKADIFQPSFAQLLVDFVCLEKLITKELREVFPVFLQSFILVRESLIIRLTIKSKSTVEFLSKENRDTSTAILLIFDVYFGPVALCIEKEVIFMSDSYSFNPIG